MLSFLKRISGRGNSLQWAVDCECKEMIQKYGKRWLWGIRIRRALDIGSGKNEELCRVAPCAKEYHFLDNFILPPPRQDFFLHRQSAGEKFQIESSSMDLVMTNGSFDHFTDAERLNSFLEVERILKPGGLFLFACEYHDFSDHSFFQQSQQDQELQGMNCCSFSNINLSAIVSSLKSLTIVQQNLSLLPCGAALRDTPHPKNIKLFSSRTQGGLLSEWAAFMVVFRKKS